MATKKTDADPVAFLDTVAPAGRRRDALALLDLMREVTGLEPWMYGSSIVGFGEYAYAYDSGRKGTAPAAAFSPRKTASVVYLLDGIGNHEEALAKLGPHKTGVGCLYINDLTKIDLRVLKAIVRKSFKALTGVTFRKRAREAAEAPEQARASSEAAVGSAAGPIADYLAAIENATARATLSGLWTQLRELLPSATETISYGLPAFRLPSGKVVAGFGFSGKNCGYYPHSGSVVEAFGELVSGYKTTKGALSFPPDKPLPKKLVSALVRARLVELGERASAPKSTKPKRVTTRKTAPTPARRSSSRS